MTKSYVATKVDNQHITYQCNECGKDHCHGSNGDKTNRIEYRFSHCGRYDSMVEIYITNDTIRG